MDVTKTTPKSLGDWEKCNFVHAINNYILIFINASTTQHFTFPSLVQTDD